jgi:ATP-binding cassette, subfamily C (CFTR/MRP), member 1
MAAARHLFDRVIGPSGLLSTRARLLVTHAISFVPQCDHIIFLRDGRITEQGSYLELMGADNDLNQLLSEHGAKRESSSSEHSDGDQSEGKDSDVGHDVGRQRRGSVASIGRASLVSVPEGAVKEQDRGVQSLMTVEKSAEGHVAWSVYKAYISAVSISGVAATACLMLVATASDIGKLRPLTAQAWRQSREVDHTQGRVCGSKCGALRRRTRATTSTCSAT